MSRAVRWTLMVGTASGLLLSGCADNDLTAPTVSATQVVGSVTPELAAALDENGRFVFGAPAGGDVPWISADRARELAVAYVKGYGPAARRYWTEDRGAGIAERLTPCRRVFLAESGYDPFPAELIREYRRAFGATWLVSFCSGGEQQVAIAVSVESTDLTIDEDGVVRGVKSGDFWSTGVPSGTQFPVEPELGSVDIAGTVSSRVSALPRYRRLANRYSAFSGIWTYQLESGVRLRGTRSGVDIDTTVVDFSRWASVRDLRPVMANQDSTGKARSEVFAVSTDGVTWANVEVTRRVDVPVSLETFVIARNP
jgi:hypothetical protein